MFLTAGVILFTVFTSPVSEKSEDVSSEVFSDNVSSDVDVSISTTAQTTENITPSSTAAVGLININTASLDELMSLKGIGETKAQAIIDYRETYGLFPNINSLTNVSGIGEKTLSKIADKITV